MVGKRVAALFISSTMLLTLFSNVYAQDNGVLEGLKSETNPQSFAEVLDKLTDAEKSELGIDTSVYDTLKLRSYVAKEIMAAGFEDSAEFKAAFDNAIDTLTYEKEYPVSIKKYVPSSYSPVDDSEESIVCTRTYLYFTANEIENPQNLCRLDFAFSSNEDEFDKDYLVKYSTEENGGNWSAYEAAMNDLSAQAVENQSKKHRFAVWKGNLDSETFTIKTKNKRDLEIYLNGADEELRPKYVAIYDKTSEIASECAMEPADGSDNLEIDIEELVFSWRFDINTDSFNKTNVSITDATADEAFVEYDIECDSARKQKIVFKEDLQSEHKYFISFKNILDSDNNKVVDREFSLSTKGIVSAILPKYNAVLSKDGETSVKFDILNESGNIITEADVAYSIADNDTAELVGGKIKAKSFGKTTINAEFDGFAAQIPLYVKAKSINEDFENFEGNTPEHKKSGYYSVEGVEEGKKLLDCSYDSFVAQGYFYDDLTGEKAGGISAGGSVVGINTEISQAYYTFGNEATRVKRSEGWHEVIFDAEDSSVYIDGVKAGTAKTENSLFVSGEGIWFDDFSFNYIKDSKPEIKDLKIDGIKDGKINIGDEIKAVYSYYDADNDVESETEYGFYCSDTEDGEYLPFALNQDSFSFKTGEYLNKYVKFIITPKNAVSEGDRYETPAYEVVIGEDIQIIINKINNGDVYEIQTLIKMYYSMFDIDIDKINEFANPLYIYDELVGRNFTIGDDVKKAIESAAGKYLVEYKYPIGRALCYSTKEKTVTDITDAFRQSTYLYQILIEQKIENVPAVRGIAYSAFCSHLANHFTRYSYEALPDNVSGSEFESIAAFMKPVNLLQEECTSDAVSERRKFVYPDNIINNIGKDGYLTTFITNTDNRVMYFNNNTENQRPYYLITYDKTALNEMECTTFPGNFEKDIDPNIGKMTFDWNINLAENVWEKENIEVYNEDTQEKVNFSLGENEILFDGKLDDETNYTVKVKNIVDSEGNTYSEKIFKFMTTGKYTKINIMAKTALEEGESTELTVGGVLESGKTNNIPVKSLIITSDNDKIVSVENGKITANHRGIACLTVTKKNYDGSAVSKKIIITVYLNNVNEDFESGGNSDYSYSGTYSKPSDEQTMILVSGTYKDAAEVWYYDKAVTGGSISFGAAQIDLTSAPGEWHQVMFVNDGKEMEVYIDGELKQSVSPGESTSLTAIIHGEAYIDNCNISDVKGTPCRAENVVIRGASTVGSKVDGHYGYFDDDNDAEEGTETYFVISSGSGYTKIADGASLTLTSDMAGKNIHFVVVPKNFYDVGNAVYSESFTVNKSFGGGSSSGSGGSSSNSGGTSSSSGFWAGDITSSNIGTSETFGDISEGYWAYDAIYSLKKKGIISGRTETSFEPEASITKAEFVKLAMLAIGKNETTYKNSFNDINSEDWYAGIVQTAFDAGIVNGSDGNFEPNKKITREEMVKIIICAYRIKTNAQSSDAALTFADADDISEWAREYAAEAVSLGIVNGMDDNCFAPKATATRAQAAVIINRLINL